MPDPRVTLSARFNWLTTHLFNQVNHCLIEPYLSSGYHCLSRVIIAILATIVLILENLVEFLEHTYNTCAK